jgi:uncharacterized membrane protein YcaP (DUF421 family)
VSSPPATWAELAGQVPGALLYYSALVFMMRFAGKRFAGATTTFDLLVLISLSVVVQQALLAPGRAAAVIFVVTVFLAHLGLGAACRRWKSVCSLVRGGPRVLVRDGHVLEASLRAEGMTASELAAGLRKAGHASPKTVKLAMLEETGHVSAVGYEEAP